MRVDRAIVVFALEVSRRGRPCCLGDRVATIDAVALEVSRGGRLCCLGDGVARDGLLARVEADAAE